MLRINNHNKSCMNEHHNLTGSTSTNYYIGLDKRGIQNIQLFSNLYKKVYAVGTHWYGLCEALPMSTTANAMIEKYYFSVDKYSYLRLFYVHNLMTADKSLPSYFWSR